jgi:DNA repair protein RadC
MERLEEIGLTRKPTNFVRTKITSSKDSYDVIKQFYHQDITLYESFFLLLLNNSNETIGFVKISQGGITGTVVDVRIIAKYCVEVLATSCILAHNHPSGKLRPSDADLTITKKTKEALAILDVRVLDHIILTEEGHYSFADDPENYIL